uniref:Nucleotidyltransferase family protein n=1 Tax=Anaerolinea thermolimosa TaxID=229919 RepID=A0A7C4PLP9_9CHLR
MRKNKANLAAVVVAAGQSRRMGRPKLTLPWGNTTIIEQVIDVLTQCNLYPIVVVTGGNDREIREILHEKPVLIVKNTGYESSEMVDSVKLGINSLPSETDAVMIVLGDQPQIHPSVVGKLIDAFQSTRSFLVVPSYRMRRGHPWLVEKSLWKDLASLPEGHTLRDFLNQHNEMIHYIPVDTPSILSDIDTPDEYSRQRPQQ